SGRASRRRRVACPSRLRLGRDQRRRGLPERLLRRVARGVDAVRMRQGWRPRRRPGCDRRAFARMDRAAAPCGAMSEPRASDFTDLCVVAAVDVEFKIAAGLLSGKSFSEETRMKICRGLFGGRRVTILQSGMGAPGFAERL